MTSLGFPLIHNLSIQRQGIGELLDLIEPEELYLEKGLDLLVSLQVRVLFHLRVEDDLLVASLDAEARRRADIASIMNQWVYPIRSCAELAQAFFEHWLGLEAPVGDLQGDWVSLRGLLVLRMETSERLLFPAYQALHNERRKKSRPAAVR